MRLNSPPKRGVYKVHTFKFKGRSDLSGHRKISKARLKTLPKQQRNRYKINRRLVIGRRIVYGVGGGTVLGIGYSAHLSKKIGRMSKATAASHANVMRDASKVMNRARRTRRDYKGRFAGSM